MFSPFQFIVYNNTKIAAITNSAAPNIVFLSNIFGCTFVITELMLAASFSPQLREQSLNHIFCQRLIILHEYMFTCFAVFAAAWPISSSGSLKTWRLHKPQFMYLRILYSSLILHTTFPTPSGVKLIFSRGNYDTHLNKRKSDVSERILITRTNACVRSVISVPLQPSGGTSVDEYECVNEITYENHLLHCFLRLCNLSTFKLPDHVEKYYSIAPSYSYQITA